MKSTPGTQMSRQVGKQEEAKYECNQDTGGEKAGTAGRRSEAGARSILISGRGAQNRGPRRMTARVGGTERSVSLGQSCGRPSFDVTKKQRALGAANGEGRLRGQTATSDQAPTAVTAGEIAFSQAGPGRQAGRGKQAGEGVVERSGRTRRATGSGRPLKVGSGCSAWDGR